MLPSVTEVRTVAVDGEIDPWVVIELQRRINNALDTGHRRIVIDPSAVTVLGAQTSLMLGGVLRRLTRRRVTLAIVASPPPVRRVLELCAIDGIAFYPDLDAAMSDLNLHPRGAPGGVRLMSEECQLNEQPRKEQIETHDVAGFRGRPRAIRGTTPFLTVKGAM